MPSANSGPWPTSIDIAGHVADVSCIDSIASHALLLIVPNAVTDKWCCTDPCHSATTQKNYYSVDMCNPPCLQMETLIFQSERYSEY